MSELVGWIKEFEFGGYVLYIFEIEEYGILLFVYKCCLFFYVKRFNDWLESMLNNVVWLKGIVWLV